MRRPAKMIINPCGESAVRSVLYIELVEVTACVADGDTALRMIEKASIAILSLGKTTRDISSDELGQLQSTD